MAGPDLTSDMVLAGYRILEPIGRGGMGVVYRAEEPALGRLVGLKVLAPSLAAHEEFRRRFLREMRLAARGLRFAAGWAIGAWFVPILGLVRPKQVLNDIWRASDPDLAADDDGSWRRAPVPSVLTWWWLAFLASLIVRAITTESVHTLAVMMTFGLASRPLDQVQPTSGVQSLADLLTVVAGLLALRVVRIITTRQEARAAKRAVLPPRTP